MRLQKVLHGLSRRPHEHVHSSLRCNQGARLDGECARAVVPHARTRRAHTARSDCKRRPTARRCGGAHYLRDQAGSRSLVFDLSIAHDRFGSSSHVQQNGSLSHPQDIDAPLRIAAQREIAAYRQQYSENQNISFLPAIVSTSTRMHGEFWRLLFLQAHRETEAHFTAAGMSS